MRARTSRACTRSSLSDGPQAHWWPGAAFHIAHHRRPLPGGPPGGRAGPLPSKWLPASDRDGTPPVRPGCCCWRPPGRRGRRGGCHGTRCSSGTRPGRPCGCGKASAFSADLSTASPWKKMSRSSFEVSAATLSDSRAWYGDQESWNTADMQDGRCGWRNYSIARGEDAGAPGPRRARGVAASESKARQSKDREGAASVFLLLPVARRLEPASRFWSNMMFTNRHRARTTWDASNKARPVSSTHSHYHQPLISVRHA